APNPGAVSNDAPEFASPPPISQISSGPTAPPRENPPPSAPAVSQDPFPALPPEMAPSTTPAPATGPGSSPFGGEADTFVGAGGSNPSPAPLDPSAGAPPSPSAAAGAG